MEKLRIGVIGTGNISNCHMDGYKALGDMVEVVACCDIDEQKMNAWADRWGVEKRYTDYCEMLEKENLHAVSVCIHTFVRYDSAPVQCLYDIFLCSRDKSLGVSIFDSYYEVSSVLLGEEVVVKGCSYSSHMERTGR